MAKRGNVKQDIKEKVREIRLMQHNWMKERNETLTNEPAKGTSLKSAKHSTKSASAISTHSQGKERTPVGKPAPKSTAQVKPRVKSATERSKPSSISSNPPSKAKFKHWLQSREEKKPVEISPDETEDIDDTETDLDVPIKLSSRSDQSESRTRRGPLESGRSNYSDQLESRTCRSNQLDSGRSDHSDQSDSRTCRSNQLDSGRSHYSDQSDLRSRISGSEFSPEMFDALADQIISRVKSELHFPNGEEEHRGVGRSNGEASGEVEDSRKRKAEVPSSHKCSQCSARMVPPTHSATLLIPCGHTLCHECAEGYRRCPECRSEINSLTGNIMLQQIIMEYSSEKVNLTSSERVNSGRQKSQASQGSYRPDVYRNVPSKATDYDEAYQSLCIRQEALQTEAMDIEENMQLFSKTLKGHRKQLGSICQQEEHTEAEIETLKRKLESLRAHKLEYEEKCEEMEKQHFAEASRLALLQETLQSISREKEKTKILAGH